MKYIVYLLLIICFINCKQKINSQNVNDTSKLNTYAIISSLPYDLDDPDTILILQHNLNEISGLEYDAQSDRLLCHNDEKGHIYVLDSNYGSELDKIKFSKSRDYEGIAKVDDKIYVTSNSGNIFEYNVSTTNTTTHKTPLSAANDVEGLCVDIDNNALLMACKGQPIIGSKVNDKKCIYSYDLSANVLNPDPMICIEDSLLVKWVTKYYSQESGLELRNKIKRIKEFSPSGISYTNNQEALYVLSAKGSTLIVLDQLYNLQYIHFFNQLAVPQPEGICFDKQNTLYISSEGKAYSGKIFKYKKNVE